MSGTGNRLNVAPVLVGGVVIYVGYWVVGLLIALLLFDIRFHSAAGAGLDVAVKPRSFPPWMGVNGLSAQVAGLILDAVVALIGGMIAGSMASVSKAVHGLAAGLAVAAVLTAGFLYSVGGLGSALRIGHSSGVAYLAVWSAAEVVLIIALAWYGGWLAAEKARKEWAEG